jgi:hypothetical protein
MRRLINGSLDPSLDSTSTWFFNPFIFCKVVIYISI